MELKNKRKYDARLLTGLAALATVILLTGLMLLGMEATRPEPTVVTTTAPTLAANPYAPGDFAYEGAFLTCTAGESILGIDVSTFQKNVDWQQVKDAGVEFVMIRLGYRGYETGQIHTDNRAQEHYAGAKAAGLKIGAYFYSQAITVQEAIAEAEYAMSILKDWELDLPLVYDWEYVSPDARTGAMEPRLLTDCTIAFCQTVERGGYEPMVYFNTTQSRELLYLEELTDYPFWLAQYTDAMDFPYRVRMWQYTATGAVPGVEGNVDINLWLP